MAKEIEIKLRVADLPGLRTSLRRLGASVQIPRVHEWNELFETTKRELRKREQLLRIRTETSPGKSNRAARTILTFKGPVKGSRNGAGPQRHKVREELELELADPQTLETILGGLGMRVWFRYEKYRTTYRLPKSAGWAQKLLIELDETPIGTYVELEGPRRAIDRAANALGYSGRDFITANYYVLYREDCRRAGKKIGDMLFTRRGRH